MQKVPNANKKLQNIRTVKEMLSGEHRTQTRTVIGYEGNKDNIKREIGERWTDENGICWEQRDGFRVKHADKADFLKELNDLLKMPSHCPRCQKPMGTKLDKKFWHLEHQCFDCQVEFETKLRIKGEYQEYERKKMLANVKSWIEDARKEKEVLKNELTKNTFVNANGSLEKWSLPYDPEVLKKQIDENFEKFEKELLAKYGEL